MYKFFAAFVEVACVGLTEDQAQAQAHGIKVKKGMFPWTGHPAGR